METHNSKAGQITEDVMARVRQKLPKIQTHEYNRTYEAVLESMQHHFKEQKIESISRPFAGFYDSKKAGK